MAGILFCLAHRDHVFHPRITHGLHGLGPALITNATAAKRRATRSDSCSPVLLFLWGRARLEELSIRKS